MCDPWAFRARFILPEGFSDLRQFGLPGRGWWPLDGSARAAATSFSANERFASALRASGWQIDSCPFDGGHEVSLSALRGLERFLGGCNERLQLGLVQRYAGENQARAAKPATEQQLAFAERRARTQETRAEPGFFQRDL